MHSHRVVLSILLMSCTAASAQVQVSPSTAPPRRPAASTGSAYTRYQQQIITFLMNPTYQKELEMTEEQTQLVKDLNKKLYDGYQKIYAGYPELKDKKLEYKKRSEIYRKIQEEYAVLRKKIEEEMIDGLVPNQKTILTQLTFNQALTYYGLSATLTQSQFSKEFKTTENQKKELQKIKRETEIEIQKLIQEKRQAARDKMLKLLNAEQRKKLKELQGDKKKKLPYVRL